MRSGENPARWRGHIDALLPRRSRLTRGHHKAMPFDDVPAFIGNCGPWVALRLRRWNLPF
jgi:hypothetical protein